MTAAVSDWRLTDREYSERRYRLFLSELSGLAASVNSVYRNGITGAVYSEGLYLGLAPEAITAEIKRRIEKNET